MAAGMAIKKTKRNRSISNNGNVDTAELPGLAATGLQG
jgi:hypothetical protein